MYSKIELLRSENSTLVSEYPSIKTKVSMKAINLNNKKEGCDSLIGYGKRWRLTMVLGNLQMHEKL